MIVKIDPSDLELSPFDPAELLRDDETIILYLQRAFETTDEAIITKAIGTAARAKGMTEIAEKAGLARTSLYRGLSDGGKPQFGTILAVMAALGFELVPKAA